MTTAEMVEGAPLQILYAAGFGAPLEPEDAVRTIRSIEGERYRALKPITDESGPKVAKGEVREI